MDVVAVGKDLASPPSCPVAKRRIDMSRCRDLEPLHPARERVLAVGLDQHVHVVSLQADMNDPESLAQRGGDGRMAYRLVQLPAPQATDRRHHAQHDVQRVIGLELRPPCVTHASARAFGLPSGAAPLASATK